MQINLPHNLKNKNILNLMNMISYVLVNKIMGYIIITLHDYYHRHIQNTYKTQHNFH